MNFLVQPFQLRLPRGEEEATRSALHSREKCKMHTGLEAAERDVGKRSLAALVYGVRGNGGQGS